MMDMSPLGQIREFLDNFGLTPQQAVIGLVILLVGLLILRKLWTGITRAVRRSRPPRIHPKLQKYNVDYAELSRQRKELATGIIATSTGGRLHGYRVVRQVEAVFVDGCRTPDEAMIALKAAAAERGANAIVNVKTERSSAGKCSAAGDAIVAAAMLERPARGQSPDSGDRQ